MEKGEINLTCPKCETEYNATDRVPLYMTTCDHVYCRKCIQKMLNDLRITEFCLKCPQCNVTNKLDSSFKRNIKIFQNAEPILKKVMDLQKERNLPKCKNHPENNTIFICIDCQTTIDELFCQSCITAKHQNCNRVLIQPKNEFDQILKKSYIPINSNNIKSNILAIIDGHLKTIRENFEAMLKDSLQNFDNDYARQKEVHLEEYIADQRGFVLAATKKDIRLLKYIDPFLNGFVEKLEESFKATDTVLLKLDKDIRSQLRTYTWLEFAINENFQVKNMKKLLIECEKYPKIEELITRSQLNALRFQHSLLEKQEMEKKTFQNEESTSKVHQYGEMIEQYVIQPNNKSEPENVPDQKIIGQEILRNPPNSEFITARITQGLNEKLRHIIEQGEAFSKAAITELQTETSNNQTYITGDRFVIIENWILSRKISATFKGKTINFARKPGSFTQTLHCLVSMAKIKQESLFRIRLINYDNTCCSHFGFCDVKEIECIKNNKMRFSSRHARCYVTNGYAPSILASQQYFGVKWGEDDTNFQNGDLIYIHFFPQKVLQFYMPRQNLTISFEKFDIDLDLRLFMTIVMTSNVYEFEQLL